METSKKLLYIDIAIAVIVSGAVIVGEFLGLSMVESAIVAGLWDAQLAVVVGFYLWKSKNENRSKHAMALVRELAGKYGIDAVANLAETILKD